MKSASLRFLRSLVYAIALALTLSLYAQSMPNPAPGPGPAALAAGEPKRLDLAEAISLYEGALDQAWAIELQARQVLLAGGGVQASVRSARLTREAAELDLQ